MVALVLVAGCAPAPPWSEGMPGAGDVEIVELLRKTAAKHRLVGVGAGIVEAGGRVRLAVAGRRRAGGDAIRRDDLWHISSCAEAMMRTQDLALMLTTSGDGARGFMMRLSIILLALSVLVPVAGADFPQLAGPGFPPGDMGVVGESIGNQEEVHIAAGGSGFLVVWTDMRTSYNNFQGLDQNGRDVYAARLDASGNLIDTTPTVVSQDFGSQDKAEAAWNGQNWLVVWENQTPSGTGAPPMKIFGARVSAEGTVLDTPFEIFEAPDYAGSIVTMAVAANGTEWLVVGHADSGGPLAGVRVAADGVVLDPAPVALVPDTTTQYAPARLHVAQDEYLLVYKGEWNGADWIFEARRFAADLSPIGGPIYLTDGWPHISSNGTEYFIAWDPPGPTLLGSRMSLDGTLLDPAGIPLMESFWDPIQHTRVEWDGTNWWILHSLPYPDGGLHLARVSPAGVVIDSPPFHAFDPADEEFVGPFELEANPAGGVQLVWADQDCSCPNEWGTGVSAMPWDIRGAFISAGAQISPDAAISSSPPAQTYPDLTAGPDGFLALYVSEVDDVQRIMVRRLDALGSPLDAQPIEIASGPYVTNPEAAWNGSVYLITWDEFYYCVGGDWPPCGNFVHAVRMLPDGTILDAEPIVVMPASDGDVAALGDGTHSTEQHPTHAYPEPGLYTVTLTVGGSCGSDSTTMVDLIQVDPPCDQVRQALSDIPVVGALISGDYTSTHVYDDQDFELFYEVLANDGAGYYSILEHRWDFDVAAGGTVTFHANTYTFPDRVDGFRFEYSTNGTIFVPLVDIPLEYGSLTAPLPPDTSGTVYIRLVDTDRTPGHYPLDGVSVDFMSIDTFVPLPSLFADSFESGDTSRWIVTVP